MANARIIHNGIAVRVNGMSEFTYFKTGHLFGFKYNEIEYRYCLDVKNGLTSGYYSFNDYLDYIVSVDSDKRRPTPFPFSDFEAQIGDIITIYQRSISNDFTNVCWYTYQLNYSERKNYGAYNLKIEVPSHLVPIGSPNCTHTTSGRNFYNNNIPKAISTNDFQFAELLADIEQYIDYIENYIFDDLIFTGSPYTTYISNQRSLWDNPTKYDYSTREEYKRYYSRLGSFMLYFQSYRKKIGEDSTLIFLYLTALLSPEAIQDLLVSIKRDMLIRLAIGDNDNWQLFYYNPEDDESVVVKIVNSISEEDADKFLDIMIQPQLVDIPTPTTRYDYKGWKIALYFLFYDKFNNSTLGIGKNNLTKFVMSMYTVWRASNYNPYKNGVFSQINFDKFHYNNLVATNPDPNANWWKDVLDLSNDKFNFNASPIILNYISSNVGGIYFDNFDFYFNSDPDFYGGLSRLGSTGFGSKYKNLDEAPKGFGKVFAVKKDYTETGEAGLYGTYDFYQPVMLVNSNQDSAVKIPVINGDKEVIIEGDSQKINSLIPIFVLKYIDDFNDDSDFYTSIGYTVDVVSIVAGGYGLITKLRYLRNLSKFTPAIIAGTDAGSVPIFTLYLSSITEGITFFSSTVSFLIKLTGEDFKDEPWYETLITTVTWVELLSAGGSVLADKMLKISGKKLVNEFNANGWPDEFITDARGVEARNTLNKIANVAIDLLANSQRKVREILADLKKKEGKYWSSKFSELSSNGQPLHTQQAISDMVEIAHRAGVPDYEIAELIHISYLKNINKRIETPQLLLQIRYYSEVTRVKGYVAGFTSLANYKGYCNAIKNYWDDLFQYWDDLYGTSFKSLKYDLRIQGSAVRKRLPTDPLPLGTDPVIYANLQTPGDIEFAMLLDEANFQKFINEQKKIADLLLEEKNIKMNEYILKDMRKSDVQKNIKITFFEGMYKNKTTISSQLKQSAKPYTTFPNNKDINFAIIETGSRLALGPFVPFLY